ncbi:unnamed protein product, partial [Rotaria magnacalcarata]
WPNFGFSGRKDKDGKYQRINGFASCFTCRATYVFQSDGTGSTKHLLRHKCSKVQEPSDGATEGPLEKLLKSKPKAAITLSTTNSTKMKDELTKWICKSVRPFNIVSDIGLRDVLQTVLELGRQYQSLDSTNLLVSPTTVSKNAENNCLCLCPDLWSDKFRKVNYLDLTTVFADKDYELMLIDLSCSEYQEPDKTGDSVLQTIRRQGSNILKALKGQPLILCFAHRINNVLKRCFYETAQRRRNILASITPTKQAKRSTVSVESTSDESSSEDEVKTSSPLKYVECNTSLSDLPTKASELLDIITTSKQLVKYVKQVRSVLSRSTNTKPSIKLHKINSDGLKDLIRPLSVFKDVSTLVQTGTRPSLHMAYIGGNKLEYHLNGSDADENGDSVPMDNRHEGTSFFRKLLLQLLRIMFVFDEKHLAATILHPSYRKLTFATAYSKSIVHSYIRSEIAQILGLNSEQDKASSEPARKKLKSMEDQFQDPDDSSGIDVPDIFGSTTLKNDELDRYLNMPIDDVHKISNPLPFWELNEKNFPCLSLIAPRPLCIPVTSASVKRSFSAAGLVITERQSSLDPQTINDILFCAVVY